MDINNDKAPLFGSSEVEAACSKDAATIGSDGSLEDETDEEQLQVQLLVGAQSLQSSRCQPGKDHFPHHSPCEKSQTLLCVDADLVLKKERK